ncbi:MAG: ABC transporter substrate-binding protein [Proteobacteria bacterium]|nr:ABC transporter substrate-binding protein [Pseudomonadota bacterium]
MSKRNMIIGGVAVLIVAAIGLFYYLDVQEKKRLAIERKIRQETLIVAFNQMPDTLNPLYEQNAAGLTLLDPLFDGLANRSGREPREYIDGLATDFIQDEKNRNIFIVELDQEKRWHDDPEHMVTARDVRFTVECIKNPNNRSPLRGRINQLIDRVDIVDNFTVRIVFKENISIHVVRDLLAFKIIPTQYYGKPMSLDLRSDPVAQEFARKPIGTGPYKFDEWTGNTLRFTSTKAEVGTGEEEVSEQGLAKESIIRTIEATLVHDQEKQVRMMIDGKLDLILETSPNLHAMLDEKGLKHANYIPLHFYAIAFNTISPKFSNKKVRQAVAKAVNKLELAQQVRSGEVEEYLNLGPFAHNDDKRYQSFKDMQKFDLKAAKKLMRRNKGFNTTLIFQDDASKTMERLASKAALQLEEIGIKVETKGLGLAFDTQIQNKNFEMALVRHSGFTDGYNIARFYRSDSPSNITSVSSERLNKILDSWENSAFWEQRLPAAKTMHAMISDMSPYVFLMSLPTSAYHSARLDNVMIFDPNALLGSVEEWVVLPATGE